MCGIAGIFSPEILPDEKPVKAMTLLLSHRGPDAQAIWSGGHIHLGHTRLSIIDLSDAANQPFHSADGRYVIVFNGEIYNYRELKASLQINYAFSTSSDTEVLLAAYAEWGAACLSRLKGMFAFAIWDRQKEALFVARDRLGIKPLYYYCKDGQFLFASEIRSLLASGLIERKLDETQLSTFLFYQTVHQPDTLVEGMKQLEAGSYAIINKNGLGLYSWWKLWDGKEPVQDSHEACKKTVKELFLAAVERRMVSDVPLGAFLSGGIDSSLIVACMAELSDRSIDTFSVLFEEEAFDESAYSSLIAKKYKTKHHPIHLRPSDFLDEMPLILAAMDAPSGDGPNTYMVSKKTKEAGVTVALSGLGGDELFAGYSSMLNYHSLQGKNWLWAIPKLLRRPLSGLARLFLNDHRGYKLAKLLSTPRGSLGNLYPTLRQAFSREEAHILQGRQAAWPVNLLAERLCNIDDEVAHLAPLSQACIGEIESYTRDVLLRDTDQMSMAHALEVRVPFFDHTLLEYVLGIPDAIKYPHYPKQLLVEAMSPRLPDEVVHRKKMGFTLPWEHWLKNELAGLCREKIAFLSHRPEFHAMSLQDYYTRFLTGDKKVLCSRIWQLVVLGDWLERNDIQ